MRHLEDRIDRYINEKTVQHIAVRAGKGDAVLCDVFRGADECTLFDMASVTKMMATTTLALLALDRGLFCLDDPVNRFFATEKPLTLRHVLTHTIGFGYRLLNSAGNTPENIAQKILEIPEDLPIGSDVRYSCPGFILLGKILEKVLERPLNKAFDELVAAPLGLQSTGFLPSNRHLAVNANLAEELRGTVNDDNSRHLGGVAGNAGVFSNLADVTRYVKFMLAKGKPLIHERTFLAAAQNYTQGMQESRGLGFLYVDEGYTQTGGLFANGAIGHCGHTGQSVFADYRTGLYVIILSDATVSVQRKYGKEHYEEVKKLRAELHAAIKQDLEEGN